MAHTRYDDWKVCEHPVTKIVPPLLLPATQPSVFCLTETWLTLSVSQPEVTFEGCTLFRSDRAVPRRGGGVALYVKSLLMPARLVIDATSPRVETAG